MLLKRKADLPIARSIEMDLQPSRKARLRLYVAGTSARSSLAIENIHNIIESKFKDRYSLEVVDIYQQPELAEQDNIVAAPTLVRSMPPPIRRVVGDMSDTQRVVQTLII